MGVEMAMERNQNGRLDRLYVEALPALTPRETGGASIPLDDPPSPPKKSLPHRHPRLSLPGRGTAAPCGSRGLPSPGDGPRNHFFRARPSFRCRSGWPTTRAGPVSWGLALPL